MKKLLIPVVILLVCAFIVTGCSSGTATTTPTTTTTIPPTTTAATTAPPTTSAAPSTTAPKPSTSTSVPATSAPASSIPATGNKYGGLLRVIETAAPGAPIGAEWEGNLGTYNTQQWVEERLLKEGPGGQMIPELVESYDVTSTGNDPNVVLHVRKGVKFQDGSDWNAQALAWNLNIFKVTNQFGSTTNYWKSWDIVDDYTVKLHYTQYLNTLTRAWENYFMYSPTAYTKNGIEWVRTHMVGTGPFAQTDFQRDVSLTAVKNTNYWQQGKPYLDQVQLLYVADETTRTALMKSGGAEMMNALLDQAAQFQGSDYQIFTKNGGPTMLVPDSKNAASPWANAQVRMAAEYAIDRPSLAKTFGYGYAAPAFQMSSKATLAYDPALEAKARNYDPVKAKQLLTDAGYPNGFKTTMSVAPGVDRNPSIAIQAYLAKIGITVALDYPEPASWQVITTQPAKVNTLIYIPLNEWSNYNTTLNVFFSGTGFYFPTLKKPDAFDAQFNASKTAPAATAELLKPIADGFFDECTIIPLVYSTFMYIAKSSLMDSKLTYYGTPNAWDYANVWLQK